MSAARRALPEALALVCSACGARSEDPHRFACAAAVPGDDVDHVLVPPESTDTAWPPPGEAPDDPYIRYRRLLFAYRLHRAWGGSDREFVVLVGKLQTRVASVDGRRFEVTPLRCFAGRELVPDRAPAAVWVKDETANVSGSHKGRHFFGLALYLAVLEAHDAGWPRRPTLAIASCGNAALAAAVLARATGWALDVYVPPEAAPSVVARLETLGAAVHPCQRRAGQVGDPCQRALETRLAEGAIAFSAQGPSNGLSLDGAATLGYELADQWSAAAEDPAASAPRDLLLLPVERLYVQVGGGALASGTMTGLERAQRCGRLATLPALHTVQAVGGAPFSGAARALSQVLRSRRGAPADQGDAVPGPSPEALAAGLQYLAVHRSEAMRPWPTVPRSCASGILDDETYDWRSVLGALARSGGRPVLVDEDQLLAANGRVRAASGIDVDVTGSAGLAGVWADAAAASTAPTGAVAVLATGARR